MLKVAVKLPSISGDVGEYLADVSALEAAGADTIWLEGGGLDAWVVLGALAAVTHRSRLGCMLTSGTVPSVDGLSASVNALQKLSRGRLVLGVPPTSVAAVRQAGAKIFSVGAVPGEPVDGVIFKASSPGDVGAPPDKHVEVWAAIAMPPDRETWTGTLNALEAAGATGMIVPWSARVIDLLRNSEPDDRTDLLISTG